MSKEAAAKAARDKAEREKREASEATKASHREHAEAAAARALAEKETLEAAQAEREAKRAEREAAATGSNTNTNPEEKTMGKKNKGNKPNPDANSNEGGEQATTQSQRENFVKAAKEHAKSTINDGARKKDVYYRVAFPGDTFYKGEFIPAGTVINIADKQEAHATISTCLYIQKVENKGGNKVRTVLFQAGEDVRIPPESSKGKGSRSKDADDGSEGGDGNEGGDGSDEGAGDE